MPQVLALERLEEAWLDAPQGPRRDGLRELRRCDLPEVRFELGLQGVEVPQQHALSSIQALKPIPKRLVQVIGGSQGLLGGPARGLLRRRLCLSCRRLCTSLARDGRQSHDRRLEAARLRWGGSRLRRRWTAPPARYLCGRRAGRLSDNGTLLFGLRLRLHAAPDRGTSRGAPLLFVRPRRLFALALRSALGARAGPSSPAW
mmetsp:Transcript_22704/g.65339  ORF Transcript_22704/g.65339 Transcript_22704/m.65339 type:complete len:202 (+) Transcript_22704:127-732(+)